MSPTPDPAPPPTLTPGERVPDHAGVFVPPPLFFVIPVLVGLLLQRAMPLSLPPTVPGAIQIAVGALCLFGWAALFLWALVTFRRAGTSLLPIRPTTTVVATGPYRWSRNPMYLGLVLLVVGVGVLINVLWPILLLAPTILLVEWAVIAREERYLERKFGDEYLTYKQRVRRWL